MKMYSILGIFFSMSCSGVRNIYIYVNIDTVHIDISIHTVRIHIYTPLGGCRWLKCSAPFNFLFHARLVREHHTLILEKPERWGVENWFLIQVMLVSSQDTACLHLSNQHSNVNKQKKTSRIGGCLIFYLGFAWGWSTETRTMVHYC